MQKLHIVYQDEHFIVIDKPAGLLTVPGLSHPENAFDLLRKDFPNSRVVHRLDMATSGLVIFPQSHKCLVLVGKLFEQRKMSKKYSAIVSGLLAEDQGEIHLPLICDWPNRPKQKVDMECGKPAHTSFVVCERDCNKSQTRVMLTPHTGRTHQLRVHMQQLGHPIIGDQLYANQHIANLTPRLLLHATELSFIHPFSYQIIQLLSPAPFD